VTGPRALIVDYGGVLTSPLGETISAWLRAEQLDTGRFTALMREWLGTGAARNIVHDLETGRLDPAEFERQFAALLARSDGSVPEAKGLLRRMFAGFEAHDGMAEVVRKIRLAGRRTGLLSNSWGFDYERDGWGDLFDAVVISGEIGMRKPDPGIYLHAAARLGVRPEECVFVDDLRPNVKGAVAVGMVGIHHTDPAETVRELEILFDLVLH
jgi:putative hydrolase of the HAD superfamily